MTIYVRGIIQMMIAEAEWSIHDVLCMACNQIRDNRIVYGDGVDKIACSITAPQMADDIRGMEQYGVRGFASALYNVWIALAENSGLARIETLAVVNSRQVTEKKPYLGINCMESETNDMRDQNVYEAHASKIQHFYHRTQLVKMKLKINDTVPPGEYD